VSAARPLTIAITALGGQGGGVLANWIRELAETNGFIAQSTSVPGVAQRTGATVYYLELFPEQAAAGRAPVLALAPVAGDVDVVIAAELMEAGRAVQRGFVTPERTLLIASSHRAYAVGEKTALGNGIADGATVIAAAAAAARRFLHLDMQSLADSCGAVISAALFGALGGSAALPFAREAYEDVIRARGIATETNLRAFALAWERAAGGGDVAPPPVPAAPAPAPGLPLGSPLAERIRERLPRPVWATAWEGCRQLVDYQDLRYAQEYLDSIEATIGGLDTVDGDALGVAVARHLALWMAYQDPIRVASQKTRSARHADIRREVRAEADELVQPVEFMHPRLEEICDLMPRALGRWVLESPRLAAWLGRFFARGRLLHTYRLRGFLMLSALAALRPLRRHTLRYSVEHGRIAEWLARIRVAAQRDGALAVEIARCQRLLKGYSDTQARGWRGFSCIMEFIDGADPGSVCAEDLRRLHDAALADEDGGALDLALAEMRSAVVRASARQPSG